MDIVRTTELSDDRALTAAPDRAVDHAALVASFLGWQLDPLQVAAVTILPKPGALSFFSRTGKKAPEVVCAPREIVARMAEFVRIASEGYRLILCSNATEQAHLEFFAEYGFTGGAPRTTALIESALFEAAWNTDRLLPAVRRAFTLGGQTLCCFAHDAPSLYLLARPSPSRGEG